MSKKEVNGTKPEAFISASFLNSEQFLCFKRNYLYVMFIVRNFENLKVAQIWLAIIN